MHQFHWSGQSLSNKDGQRKILWPQLLFRPHWWIGISKPQQKQKGKTSTCYAAHRDKHKIKHYSLSEAVDHANRRPQETDPFSGKWQMLGNGVGGRLPVLKVYKSGSQKNLVKFFKIHNCLEIKRSLSNAGVNIQIPEDVWRKTHSFKFCYLKINEVYII